MIFLNAFYHSTIECRGDNRKPETGCSWNIWTTGCDFKNQCLTFIIFIMSKWRALVLCWDYFIDDWFIDWGRKRIEDNWFYYLRKPSCSIFSGFLAPAKLAAGLNLFINARNLFGKIVHAVTPNWKLKIHKEMYHDAARNCENLLLTQVAVIKVPRFCLLKRSHISASPSFPPTLPTLHALHYCTLRVLRAWTFVHW